MPRLSNRFRKKPVQVLSTLAGADADSRDVVNRRARQQYEVHQVFSIIACQKCSEGEIRMKYRIHWRALSVSKARSSSGTDRCRVI